MRSFVPLLLILLVLPVTGRAEIAAETYAKLNASLVEHHIVPRYARLETAMTGLDEAARAHCAAPDAASLAALKEGYGAAMDAWMGIQHIRFGPVELFLRAYRIQYWPEAHGKVAAALAELMGAPDTALSPEAFRSSSVAAQGLPAMEVLLYGQHDAARPDGEWCRLARAIAANLHRIAGDVHSEWISGDRPFAEVLRNPDEATPYYHSPREVSLAIFTSFHNQLQLILDAKLLPASGAGLAAAKPALAESARSGRSLRNVVVNLAALEALYSGEGGMGLGDVVAAGDSDPKLDPLLRKAFRITAETAAGIGAPLAEAVTDPEWRTQVDTLNTQVSALKQIVRRRLAAALDMTVGFNALDGD